jgi:hypothetical protein
MADKAMPITGGCLCGVVHYEASEEPTWVAHCHCRMCRQAYGHTSDIFSGKRETPAHCPSRGSEK